MLYTTIGLLGTLFQLGLVLDHEARLKDERNFGGIESRGAHIMSKHRKPTFLVETPCQVVRVATSFYFAYRTSTQCVVVSVVSCEAIRLQTAKAQFAFDVVEEQLQWKDHVRRRVEAKLKRA